MGDGSGGPWRATIADACPQKHISHLVTTLDLPRFHGQLVSVVDGV